jgi:malate dehydrogenase
MSDIAILGAGELGGALAHALALRDIARTIRLIDSAGSVAAGKALDLMQAAPIQSFSTRIAGSTDISTMGGASLVVIADRAGAGEWQGDDGAVLLKQIARMAAGSVVVCAGASQRELVERGVLELGFARTRLFGSAPEALASAIRAIVALEVNGSVKDVAVGVVGVPPAHTVVNWEDATIAGFAATRVIDEPARRRLASMVVPLWPPGPYALAAAAADVAAAIAGHSRRALSCFVAPDVQAGRKTRTSALPVRLGDDGIVRVDDPPLSVSGRVALETAMLL